MMIILDEIACADPDVCYQVCHSRNGCNDIAYPLLVLRLMPNGKFCPSFCFKLK